VRQASRLPSPARSQGPASTAGKLPSEWPPVRQFVVIAATGGNKRGTPHGDTYVAFALPM